MAAVRHILVGGNGFLGRELSRQALARGDSVVVVDMAESYNQYPPTPQARVTYVTADISRRGTLDGVALGATDVVHHLATRLITPNHPRLGRDDYFQVCAVHGTLELLRWMKTHGNRRLVFWSSDMVYGPAVTTPRTEQHPRRPFGPYGRSKVMAEDIVAAAVAAGDLTATIFRPRLILGPGRLGILTVMFKIIDKGWPLPLIGSGANRFQFVSVADCAHASLLAADRNCPNRTYNLGSDDPPTEYELLTEFSRRIGSHSRVIRTPGALVKATLRLLHLFKVAPMDPEQFEIADLEVQLDTSAAKRELNWHPKHTDTDLLEAAYRSYKGQHVQLP